MKKHSRARILLEGTPQSSLDALTHGNNNLTAMGEAHLCRRKPTILYFCR